MMRWANWSAGFFGLAVILTVATQPAQAQATRTWVSGVGDDVNPCSRTAPCKTFAGAISKTAARGEISVLDPGGFGAVTITKSISIVNDQSGEAGILTSGSNGITVNAAATDVVILRGLVIDGGTAAAPGNIGVRFIAGASLHIENTLIKNFTSTAPGGGYGILFAPSAGVSELYVTNTTLINNGTAIGATTGGGIFVQPTGSGGAFISLTGMNIQNSRIGMQLNTTTTTGTIAASISNSSFVGNTGNALSAVATTGITAQATVSNSQLSGNGTALLANGTAATIRIGGSLITSNGNAVTTSNSGSVLSYKNNYVDGNATNNTPIPQVATN